MLPPPYLRSPKIPFLDPENDSSFKRVCYKCVINSGSGSGWYLKVLLHHRHIFNFM